tara:strand:- start:3842 stop:4357 length:516 start_codon:yes stop_codon:yes gene_type:complete
MAEYFFDLSQKDRRESLEFVRTESGRPAHLLEKDIWVVWALRALFNARIAKDLTFKGGTSLSKAYKVINRFSEDIDLTYDIRKLIPDLTGENGELPSSRSQAGKWTKAVRHRLPDWVKENIQPVIEAALAKDYTAMLADELMVEDSLTFEQLLDVCADLEAIINKSRVSPR